MSKEEIELIKKELETWHEKLDKIIKEYEELSESHNYIYDAYQDAGKKMFDYQEQLNDSIPKQVLRDKIKELSDNKDFDEDVYVEEYAVDVLKELLEK